MGFTRFWRRPQQLDPGKFLEFAAACQEMLKTYDDCVTNVIADSNMVSFEGKPGCEPFILGRMATGSYRRGSYFEFCKTQQMPYDQAVQRCLELLKEHFPEVEIPEPS